MQHAITLLSETGADLTSCMLAAFEGQCIDLSIQLNFCSLIRMSAFISLTNIMHELSNSLNGWAASVPQPVWFTAPDYAVFAVAQFTKDIALDTHKQLMV
jgi:hypothetical protein